MFEWKILKIIKIVGEEPNIFYEVEGAEAMLFWKQMLEEPTMEEIAELHKVTVIDGTPKKESVVTSEWEEVETIAEPKKTNISMSVDMVDLYIEKIRGFVEEYREAFKTEDMFWKFFYEKAKTELVLSMNWLLDVDETKNALVVNKDTWVKGKKKKK